MHKKFLEAVVGGFMVGIASASIFHVGLTLGVLSILLASVSIGYAKRSPVFITCVALFLLSAGVALIRFDFVDRYFEKDIAALAHLGEGKGKTLAALVVTEPRERDLTTELVVRVVDNNGTLLRPRIAVTTASFPRYAYGDQITISGKLARPENFVGSNGREFDYVASLKKNGVYFTMLFPRIELISQKHGNAVLSFLFHAKDAFRRNFGRLMPEPHASLMSGLLIGVDESLGVALEDDFRKAGLIHIVVLSGYNMSVIAENIFWLSAFVSQRIALFSGTAGVVLFALMAGAQSSVVRASIMALVVLLARATGRRYDATRALALAATGMVFVHPRILVFDLSFQLSFLATLGLMYIAPILEKRTSFLPSRFGIRETACTTLGTQLAVFPLLLYDMGTVSLFGLFSNLLVLPLVPLLMLIGFVLGLAVFVSPFLALPFSWIGTALLSYVLWIVHFFARLPLASFSVRLFPLWGMVVLYLLYVVVVRMQTRTNT